MPSYGRHFIRYTLLLVVILLLGGCSWFGGANIPRNPPGNTQNPPTQPVAGTPSPAIDVLVQQVLNNMHLHSWNPRAETHGTITGGLYINWKMDQPGITNALGLGPSDATQGNHDPQVDLFYLASLGDYHLLHPQDTTYNGDIARATTLVLNDFRDYSLPKGWVYFYLLHAGQTLNNANLVQEAYTVASRFYSSWYDPTLGFIYNHAHPPMNYSTYHSLEAGAALIDAGQRWQNSNWVNAGESTIDHVIAASLDPRYHLFYNNMLVAYDGHDRVENYQAKPSTQGEAVTALVTAYTLTHRQQYLDVADQVLQSLFGASGLWDQQRGGFFFALDMGNGKLLNDYKETRSQALVLLSLLKYDQAQQQQGLEVRARFISPPGTRLISPPLYTRQTQQLVSVLTDHFYQATYHGFFYRVTPDFQIYMDRPGTGIGFEDYFTTEAMGLAMDALQRTEMS